MGIATAKNGKEFSSDDWQTYQKFWDWLNKKYNYKVDLAASHGNAKCGMYFTKDTNALLRCDWTKHGNAWCNPPYSNIGPWLEKGNDELNWWGIGSWLVTFLIKADATAQNYWVDNIMDQWGESPIHKIQFIYPRLPHVDPWGGVHKSNRFGSVLVHMTNAPLTYFKDLQVEWLDWRECEQTNQPG
jgi:phage N-6-adenine-methyltransferase